MYLYQPANDTLILADAFLNISDVEKNKMQHSLHSEHTFSINNQRTANLNIPKEICVFRMELKEIITKLFTVYGCSITEVENRTLIASKGSIKIVVRYSDMLVTEQDISDLQSYEQQAYKKIFITLEPVGEELRNFASNSNIILWCKKDLELEIGKAVLADADANAKVSFFEESNKKFLRRQVGKEVLRSSVEDLEIKLITIEYSPYYVYSYTCEALENGRLDIKHNIGTIGVNASTGKCEVFASKWLEETEEPEPNHTEMAIGLTEEQARGIASQAVLELNARVVEVKDERVNTIIFEKRKILPRQDSVAIKFIGLYYLPIWKVVGTNLTLLVSGMDGKIVKESTAPTQHLALRYSADEKIEVV